jgi:alkaline phosphatase D
MPTRRALLANSVALVMVGTKAQSLDLSSARVIKRIAFGSCAKQWEPQPIWKAIGARSPDVFLFLGDAIYGDWHGEDVFNPTSDSLEADWRMLSEIDEFRTFRSQVPILATWDNHDYGKHDGGAEFDLKEASKDIFLDFFEEPAGSDRRKRPGIYDAKILGPRGKRVQIILLDCRSFKSSYVIDKRSAEEKAALNIRGQYLPNPTPDATLLGDAQWAWLAGELKKPANIRIIASSTQIVADEKAMEEWGNFPLERQKLFDLIDETKAEGVILLSGNVHYSEISLTNEGPYTLTDFTASGMTHSTPAYAELANSRRVSGPFTGYNFGEVEIDWDTGTGPEVHLTCFDAIGNTQFGETVNVADLKAR